MSEALDRLDVSGLERQVEAFCQFFEIMPVNQAVAMHGTISNMHALCQRLGALPPGLWKCPDVQRTLRPAIDLHTRSSFVRRLREWPRGYPGDFETVELLMSGSPVPEGFDQGEWINWYALNTAIAQQNRNKVWWQHLKICSSLPRRILSVGCGGGADFNIAPHRFTGSEIMLLDLDPEALRLAQGRLQPYCDVHTICGDVRRGIRRAQEAGPFDAVVCGGLFDYFDERTVIFLLRELRESTIKAGGSIIFTNIAEANPYRAFIEGIADWRLLGRRYPANGA